MAYDRALALLASSLHLGSTATSSWLLPSPPRATRPPPTGNVGERRGGWVCQGEGGTVGIGGGGANVVVVAVLATIIIFTTAIASAAVTAAVILAISTAVADNAVAGGRVAGLR